MLWSSAVDPCLLLTAHLLNTANPCRGSLWSDFAGAVRLIVFSAFPWPHFYVPFGLSFWVFAMQMLKVNFKFSPYGRLAPFRHAQRKAVGLHLWTEKLIFVSKLVLQLSLQPAPVCVLSPTLSWKGEVSWSPAWKKRFLVGDNSKQLSPPGTPCHFLCNINMLLKKEEWDVIA